MDGWPPPTCTSATGRRRSRPHQLVLGARLALAPGDVERGTAELAEIVAWRRANQPGGPNAGSVFTNPPGDSAGRLIEAAGGQGPAAGDRGRVHQARQLHPGRRGRTGRRRPRPHARGAGARAGHRRCRPASPRPASSASRPTLDPRSRVEHGDPRLHAAPASPGTDRPEDPGPADRGAAGRRTAPAPAPRRRRARAGGRRRASPSPCARRSSTWTPSSVAGSRAHPRGRGARAGRDRARRPADGRRPARGRGAGGRAPVGGRGPPAPRPRRHGRGRGHRAHPRRPGGRGRRRGARRRRGASPRPGQRRARRWRPDSCGSSGPDAAVAARRPPARGGRPRPWPWPPELVATPGLGMELVLGDEVVGRLESGIEVRFGAATQVDAKVRSLRTVLEQVDLTCAAIDRRALPGEPGVDPGGRVLVACRPSTGVTIRLDLTSTFRPGPARRASWR